MSKPPIKKVKLGQLELAVWSNENRLSFSLKKSYYDKKTSKYEDTEYFGLEDLPSLIKLLENAFSRGLEIQEKLSAQPRPAVVAQQPLAAKPVVNSDDDIPY